jgi:cardiolipin synthase
VEFYHDGYEFFPALLHHIAQARHHIHIDMYIVEDDALGLLLGDALIAKSRQGVEVRLIYDDVGSWKTKEHFFERLRMAGIEVSAFMPVRFPIFARKVNYRNHRKIIVIDGQTAFIGGMNFAMRYVKGRTQPWRDTMMRVSGPAAYSLQRAFFIDWYFVDRTLITHKRYYPSFPASKTQHPILTQTVMHGPNAPQPMIQMGLMRIIMSARRYVYIQSPYFLPTEPILTALKFAAGGGVDVRLMVPLHSDAPFTDWSSRAYLRQAAEAGVQVELYRSGFLHSKMLVADDEVCTLGSTNMDFRSLENNFEANTFIYSKEVAQRLRGIFLQDEQHTVLLARIRRRMKPTLGMRLLESLTRIISPLL